MNLVKAMDPVPLLISLERNTILDILRRYLIPISCFGEYEIIGRSFTKTILIRIMLFFKELAVSSQ
jgi:hypothetical protein